jgi:hypothetical protein
MKKVIILPVSLFMHNEQQKTVAAFQKLGISKLAISWHFLKLPKFLERFRGPSLTTLFEQYRRGELTTVQFRSKIREKFPKVRITNAAFDAAWNAMQTVTPKTIDAFKEAKELAAQGYTVYLLAGTNLLHIHDIRQKANLNRLPGIPCFSYQKNLLGKDLFSQLLKDIRTEHKGIGSNEIAFFYKEPTNPKAGFFDLIKKYEYHQATQYVSKLKKEAASPNGFTLIRSLDTNDQKANVKTSLKQLGWVVDKSKVIANKPAVTTQYKNEIKQVGNKQKEGTASAILEKRRANLRS